GIREIYTPTAAQWALKFVDADGNVINNVTTANGEFWMVVSLTDYADLIGNMNKVTADGATDTINSTYDRTIAFATTLISMDGTKVVGVRENGKIVYSTPYDGATIISNYDAKDGLLKVVFQSDNNAGCDFSVGAADLAANDGELFRIKLTSTLEEAGEFDIKVVEQSALVSSSVALVNKPTAGAWETGISYSSALEFDVRGYDTIYNMAVEVEDDGYREELVIAAKNATFASDYSVLFAITEGVKDAYSKVYIVAEREQFDGDTAIESSSVTLTECSLNGSYYAFTYENFAAREIASEINATLYAEDAEGNVYYGPTISYSLRQYAENQIRKATAAEEFKTMMVDFLNYGAAAQTHFGYNTSDLANSGLTEDELALASPERDYVDSKSATVDSTKAVNITNFNLVFVDKITILAATDMDAATYEANKDNWVAQVSYTNFDGIDVTEEIALNDESLFNLNGTRYVLNFAGLKSREMDKVVTIKICDKEGNVVSNTVTYSVESYAYSKGTGETTLAKLVRNLIKFGDSNIAYFSER
ncbi:MAG: hypothetical protein II284_05040, partial [Clostridia bacterium]|nr:hypothetical protein [Clostridia bacterium]